MFQLQVIFRKLAELWQTTKNSLVSNSVFAG